MASAPAWCSTLSPLCEGMPAVTRDEITQEIERLTEDIRTLRSASPTAAAEHILH
jgi:hypothetical protein